MSSMMIPHAGSQNVVDDSSDFDLQSATLIHPLKSYCTLCKMFAIIVFGGIGLIGAIDTFVVIHQWKPKIGM